MGNDLFNKHINLVYKIAHRMNYGYIDLDDLIQVGLMALYEASIKYKPSYNTKFSTFASIYIISAIKKELRQNKPISLNKEIIKLSKQLKQLDSNLSVEELAKKLNTSKENIILALTYGNEVISLNQITQTDQLIDLIPDKTIKSISHDDLEIIFSQLDEISKKIIYYKYYCGYTQQQLAKLLSTSQSQVSRLEKKALQKIKQLKY